MPSAKNFFTEAEKQEIVNAIFHAEQLTSGEIKVHLENKYKGNILDRAVVIFKQLKMDKTALSNGVLIYIAVANKQFCIIGDEGINKKVPKNFWESIVTGMRQEFAQSRYLQGLIQGIEQCGVKLKLEFPIDNNDINELGNEISFNNE